MQTKHIFVLTGMLGSVTMTSLARAQETERDAEPGAGAQTALAPGMHVPSGASAPISTEAATATDGHATGLMLQARVQAQTNLLSIGGSGFLVGYQGSSFALGLGLGLTRIGVNSGDTSGALTLFQVAPTAIIDVWHSRDGRARANILGSVGYARASLSATTSAQDCSGSSCTTSNSSGDASASLIPITLGFGGDYYLSRNFALGAELGAQAMILAGANVSESGGSHSVDAGGNFEAAYGALRATFVIGD